MVIGAYEWLDHTFAQDYIRFRCFMKIKSKTGGNRRDNLIPIFSAGWFQGLWRAKLGGGFQKGPNECKVQFAIVCAKFAIFTSS